MTRSRDHEMDEFDDNANRFGMDDPDPKANGGFSYDDEGADKLELGDGRKNPFDRLRDEDIYGAN